MSVYHLDDCYPQKTEEGADPVELELWVAAIWSPDSGNQTWVLCKSHKILTVEPTLQHIPPILKPFLKNALENAELRDRGYSLVVTCLPSMHRALGLVLSTHEPGMVVHFYKSSPGEAGPGRSQVKAILRNTEV